MKHVVVQVLEDMKEKLMPVDDRLLRAMLNACSASGDVTRAIEFLEEMLCNFPAAADIHVFAETMCAPAAIQLPSSFLPISCWTTGVGQPKRMTKLV